MTNVTLSKTYTLAQQKYGIQDELCSRDKFLIQEMRLKRQWVEGKKANKSKIHIKYTQFLKH